MSALSDEPAIMEVLAHIDAAWRTKRFVNLEKCFDENAVIVGPSHTEYAAGRKACAESYREFATNAAVREYSETGHRLRSWPDTAVYTFSWQMVYERENGPKRESGTDQFVLARIANEWRILFRYIHFAPSD